MSMTLDLDDILFPDKMFVDYKADSVVLNVGLYEAFLATFLAKGQDGRDAFLVYTHLLYTHRREGTNRPWATIEYLKKGLGLGGDKIKRAKALLVKMGLIAYRQQHTGKGQTGKAFIELLLVPNPGPARPAPEAKEEAGELEGQTSETEAPEDFDDDEGTRKHSYQQYFVKLFTSLYKQRFKSNAPWAAKKDYSLLALDYKRLGKEGLEAGIRWLFAHSTRMQGFSYGSIHTFLPEAEKALADEARKLRLLKTCRACGKQSDTTGQDCPKCGEPDAFVAKEAEHAAQ